MAVVVGNKFNGEVCLTGKDCFGGRCVFTDPANEAEGGICSTDQAKGFVIAFITFMTGWAVMFILYFLNDRARGNGDRQRKNQADVVDTEEQRQIKQKISEVLAMSRRIMHHTIHGINNAMLTNNRPTRDRIRWAYRLAVYDLIEVIFNERERRSRGLVRMNQNNMQMANYGPQGGTNQAKNNSQLFEDWSEIGRMVLNLDLIGRQILDSYDMESSPPYKPSAAVNDVLMRMLHPNGDSGRPSDRFYYRDGRRDIGFLQIVNKLEMCPTDDPNWGFTYLQNGGMVPGPAFVAAGERAVAWLPRFNNSDFAREGTRNIQKATFGFFQSIKHFKVFYGLLALFYFAIFAAFAFKGDRSVKGVQTNGFTGNNGKNGVLLTGELCGFGTTCLPVPPQYNLDDLDSELSRTESALIPVLYGVMHCALFTLGLLPVPFWRGFWRVVMEHYPGSRKYIPIDDFEFFHRTLGWGVLFFLATGTVIWVVVMGGACLTATNSVDPQAADPVGLQACLAYDPGTDFEKQLGFIGNNRTIFSPIDNVTMLRVTVSLSWFPIMPLMYIAKRKPPSILPAWLKLHWFEFCYYAHIITALGTALIALAARFDVFYSVMLSFGIYVLDNLYELRNAKMYTFNKASSKVHVAGDNRTAQLRLRRQKNEITDMIHAGKWRYIFVPAINYEWHPFSITNATNDEFLEFFIRIHGDKRNLTWTGQLYEKMMQNKEFTVYSRGPYGAAFLSCFDPNHSGSVVIGAGTGVTASLSVMREFLYRRSQVNGRKLPPFVWFVWTCSRIDDILWIWDSLWRGLTDAVLNGTVNRNAINETSNMFHWLGVTIYVTRRDAVSEQAFEEFTERQISEMKREQREEAKVVLRWLKRQILFGQSMENEQSHIAKLLLGVREKLSVTDHAGKPISICFCGPVQIARVIGGAAELLTMGDGKKGVTLESSAFEFSADAQ